ncbi:hypothetical protein T265_08689 [Opisthorchis viverrini]|uniref:SNRNP25 ubiquitin-like domain-containing protein n=1 Tax=Opisthorchis viverrini TaxID=6198 RepID=A0A074ZJ84_OPIVI|nr:hypothetical protein T265_08689 [Opisthorchis viverrini]KER23415.1 hypothetical protein T265_08689 [Opisthorchis viverrini]
MLSKTVSFWHLCDLNTSGTSGHRTLLPSIHVSRSNKPSVICFRDHYSALKLESEEELLERTNDLYDQVKRQLTVILKNDQFLCDLAPSTSQNLPSLPSAKHVDDLLRLHFGQAMKLTLLRGDDVELPVVVSITARVRELQRAVQFVTTEYLNQLTRSMGIWGSPGQRPPQQVVQDLLRTTNKTDDVKFSLLFTSTKFISWKHVWKTKCLALVNPHAVPAQESAPTILCRMDDLNAQLQDRYHVRNGAVITFVNRLKRK